MTISINKNGIAYLSKDFFETLKTDKIKILPNSDSDFKIVFEHKKINQIFANERGHYVYATKKLIPGKYFINENEGSRITRKKQK
jgi:hypothetical protein